MNLDKPKVAIYLRVSTGEQHAENQEPDARRLARTRYPLEQFDHVVVHETESGAVDREGWSTLLELARQGELRAVVVWSLDRIGRRMWRVLEDVRELDRFGVALVSCREPWCDTSGPARLLMLAIFAWVAEHEHERLRERTKAGLARAALQGRHPGRPPKQYPPEVGERAAELRAAGWSLNATRATIEQETGFRIATKETLRRLIDRHEKGSGNGGPNPAPNAGSGRAA